MISATISKELIEELERRFPQKCPKVNDRIEEIFHYAGQAGIVAYLRESYEEQNRTVLNQGLTNFPNLLRSLEHGKGE